MNRFRNVLILSAVYLVFSSLWFYVDIQRLLSFSAHIYDLGVSTATLITIKDSLLSPQILQVLSPIKPIELILSLFMFINPGPVTSLAIQDFIVPISIFPLFFLTLLYTESERISYSIVAIYLFYFPVSSTMLVDFHFAFLFQPFFFFGLLLYEKRGYSSSIFFLLASMSNLLLGGITLIYLLIEIVTNRVQKASFSRSKELISIVSIFAIAALFAYYFVSVHGGVAHLFSGANYGGIKENTPLTSGYLNGIKAFLENGLYTFFLTLIPALVLLVLSKNKSNVFIIPLASSYLALILLAVPFWHLWAQYSGAYLTPFLLLYIVKVTKEISNNSIRNDRFIKTKRNGDFDLKNAAKAINISFGKLRKSPVKMYTILVVVLIIWCFYSPTGFENSPSVPGNGAWANLSGVTHITSYDHKADSFAKLVPSNASILLEDNMPIFSDRPRNFLFGPGMMPWLNSSNGIWYNYGQRPSTTVPDFLAPQVWSAVNNAGWYNAQFSDNASLGSMAKWFPYFYSHYNYGLVAVSYPYYLYERNYSGPIITTSQINVVEFDESGVSALTSQYNYTGNPTPINSSAFEIFLMPGIYEYNVSIDVSMQNGSAYLNMVHNNVTVTNAISLSNTGGLNSATNLSAEFIIDTPGTYMFFLSYPTGQRIINSVTDQSLYVI